MGEIVRITDYYAEALELFIEQYKNSTNLQEVIRSSTLQADDLETAIFEVRDLFYIDTAEGEQLDVIGRVRNEERLGRNDNDFRAAIQLRISLKISGTIRQIQNVLISFYGATYIDYIPVYPAKVFLITDAQIPIQALTELTPAGVGILCRERNDDDNPVFGFEDDAIDNVFAVTQDLEFFGKEEI